MLAATATPAEADPTLELPPPGKGTLLRSEDGSRGLALLGEASLLAIMGSERGTSYPSAGSVTGGAPELAEGRIGVLAATGALGFLFRADLSEGTRIDRDLLVDRPVAAIDRFIDDAVVQWTPRVWASVIAGRFKVPWSRFRQLERASLTPGAVPFVVDRLAPDRRWGAAFVGDVGAMSYAVGGYADLDRLELRSGEGDEPDDPGATVLDPQFDPSAGGRALAVAYLTWTPRGPIGPDHMPTPTSDPWFDTARPASGLGVMWRQMRGADRLDLSLSGQLKYQRYAAIAELLSYVQNDEIGLSIAAQASFLFSDKVVVFGRAEYDSELELWSSGGGVAFFATKDRKNKIAFVGWLRRDWVGGPRRDGAVLQIQASL